jgi:Ser/Thr protein kinase RdoA (MazF antagonist)
VVTDSQTTIVLQKINTHVFKYPGVIDQNITAVSAHLETHHPYYTFPHPLRTSDGKTLVYDEAGIPWRALPYFAGTTSYNVAPTPDYAYAAAFAFADFSRRMSGLGTEILSPTISNFHNLTLREEECANILLTVDTERLELGKNVIAQYQAYAWIGKRYRELLANQVYQQRIFHHDTKLNNILFKTGMTEVITIVDLDTIMPGYVFSDVGDLLMFGTSVFEDVTDLDMVVIDTAKWRAILDGYRAGAGDSLTAEEHNVLPFSGLIMCYMLGLRFLTDYLQGEVYFKTHYVGQNLDKAKNRLKLLTEMVQLVGGVKA